MAPDRREDRENEEEASAGDDPADRDVLLRRLHDALAATAERPVEPGAARWLGEAEAVSADVADGDAPPAAVETRLRQVRELLSHVGSTGEGEADDNLAAAREALDALEGSR